MSIFDSISNFLSKEIYKNNQQKYLIQGGEIDPYSSMNLPLDSKILEKILKKSKDIFSDFFNQDTDRKDLEKGDIIYVSRTWYKHYGVYVNQNSVIHYSSKDSDIGSDNEIIETNLKTFIRTENSKLYKLIFPEEYAKPYPVEANILSEFTSHFTPSKLNINLSLIYIINYLRKKIQYTLYSPDETVERAKSRIGEKEYNLFLNNCEHFAIWCKTGISESHQVNEFLEIIEKLAEEISNKTQI